MVVSATRQTRAVLAIGGVLIVMCLTLLFAAALGANAAETHYCWGEGLPGLKTCYGTQRWENAVYGQGTQHAVCVGTTEYGNETCSGGPGEGTYDALGRLELSQPWIYNRAPGESQVYGISFTP